MLFFVGAPTSSLNCVENPPPPNLCALRVRVRVRARMRARACPRVRVPLRVRVRECMRGWRPEPDGEL